MKKYCCGTCQLLNYLMDIFYICLNKLFQEHLFFNYHEIYETCTEACLRPFQTSVMEIVFFENG